MSSFALLNFESNWNILQIFQNSQNEKIWIIQLEY